MAILEVLLLFGLFGKTIIPKRQVDFHFFVDFSMGLGTVSILGAILGTYVFFASLVAIFHGDPGENLFL
jgi:hypothetical protein